METGIKSHLTEGKQFPFCPGCGHTVAANALNKALVEVKCDPAKTVIVTDIGCVGLTDQYFNVNAFHGLHGRVITYATGLKLANPSLEVIALMGDGGLGIGGNHFINAARRNIGITVLIFNNFNFGMTGGQHSVTTPMSGVTNTTPGGNLEFPIDVCALVKAVDGSFAARTTVYNKELSQVIAEAIRHRGFSAVDIWEPCTAYYAKSNNLNKNSLMAMMENLKFQTGIIHRNSRKEFTDLYYSQNLKKTKTEKYLPERGGADAAAGAKEGNHRHHLTKKTNIIIAGSAGERVISSSYLFAYAGILSGLFVTQKDDFPITVMTGYSVAELIFDREEILYTEIDNPDILLITSMNGYERVKNRIASGCRVIADKTIGAGKLLTGKIPANQITEIPLLEKARAFDRNYGVLMGIAALLKISDIFSQEILLEAIRKKNKPELVEKSITAVKMGSELV